MYIGDLSLLIVDDHLPMRALLQSLLKSVGVRDMRVVRDGATAIRDIKIRPADLLLVDQRLPGMSGLELVRKLRGSSNPAIARTRILMLTAHGDARHVAEARDAGVDEFLVKPFTAAALLSRMEAALTHTRGFISHPAFSGPDRRRRAQPPPDGWDRRKDALDIDGL